MINYKTEKGNNLIPAVAPLKWQLMKGMEGLEWLVQIPSILLICILLLRPL